MKHYFAALACLLLLPLLMAADTIPVTSDNHHCNIFPMTEVYVDRGAALDDTAVMRSPNLFEPTHGRFGSFGYRLRDTVWIKFSLSNAGDVPLRRILVFSNPFTEVANLYAVRSGNIQEYPGGILNKKRFDQTLQFSFPVELAPYETVQYYLKLEPRTGSLVFNLTLEEQETFYAEEVYRQMILFLFFGAMGALLVYNGFLFFISHDSVYLYYSFYLAAISLHHLSLTGIIYYFLPYGDKSVIADEAYLSVHYVNAVTVASLLFIRSFLHTRQYPKVDMLLKADVFIALSLSLLSTHEHYLLDWSVYHGFLTILLIEGVGIYALLRKNSQALYYVIAWTIALSGIFALMAYRADIFDILSTLPYYFEGTLITEALLFSIVLANKLNTLNNEKMALDAELIDRQKTEQRRLNSLVDARTRELNVALDAHKVLLSELHHRVKNNMQFITSLYALKLHQFGNEDIDAKLKDIESKIKAMGHAHEMLYHQRDLNAIEARAYFSQLIGSISNAYDMRRIMVSTTLDNAVLTASEAIYSGLIVNELIINAIKYAFNGKDGEIRIVFREEDGVKTLRIDDTGRGIPDEAVGTSFGLLMVKTLAEEQLHGSFSRENSRFIVTF